MKRLNMLVKFVFFKNSEHQRKENVWEKKIYTNPELKSRWHQAKKEDEKA